MDVPRAVSRGTFIVGRKEIWETQILWIAALRGAIFAQAPSVLSSVHAAAVVGIVVVETDVAPA